MEVFTRSVIEIIKRIPKGRVCTYGRVGRLAGKANGARQVAWILHSSSRRHNLPWHRVINARGYISLPFSGGYEEQKARLVTEGIIFDAGDRIDLEQYLWEGEAVIQRRPETNDTEKPDDPVGTD